MGGGLAWPAASASRLVSQFSAIERQQSILHGGATMLGDVMQRKCPSSPNSFPAQPAPRARHGPTALLSSPETCPTTYQQATDSLYGPAEAAPPMTGSSPLTPSADQAFLVGEQRSPLSQTLNLPLKSGTACIQDKDKNNKIIWSLVAVKLTHPLPARSLCPSNKSQP